MDRMKERRKEGGNGGRKEQTREGNRGGKKEVTKGKERKKNPFFSCHGSKHGD